MFNLSARANHETYPAIFFAKIFYPGANEIYTIAARNKKTGNRTRAAAR